MILALRSLLFNLIFYGWTAVYAVVLLPALLLPPAVLWGAGAIWIRGMSALLRFFCGLDHRFEGLERLPAGPCLIASKHQSAWDIFIFPLLVRQPIYVLKQELTWIPFFGWYLRRMGMIAIDRKGGARALKAMVKEARRHAAAGRTLVIFPEGTRTPPGTRRRYQPGVAALYRALDIPVVPVALNSGVFWRRRAFTKRPGTIRLKVLPAIPPGLPKQEFMARLEQAIEEGSAALVAAAEARETA